MASSLAAASIDPDAGKERTDEHGIAQVWVPAGTFLMGTDEADPTGELAPPEWAEVELLGERPQHEVALSSGYWIDKTEVTNEAYQAFVDAGGYQDETLWSEDSWAWLAGRDATALPAACVDAEPDQPRVCITWYESEAYAAWRGGALPPRRAGSSRPVGRRRRSSRGATTGTAPRPTWSRATP
jgi:formylglycine-generating enzyme required for sulfatase activity